MTQLELARTGVITEAMHQVAQSENIDPELIRAGVAEGTVVIPLNKNHAGIVNKYSTITTGRKRTISFLTRE